MIRRVSAKRIYRLYTTTFVPQGALAWEAMTDEHKQLWRNFAAALYEEHHPPAKLGTDIDVAERVGYLRSGADYSDVTSEEVKMETLTEDPDDEPVKTPVGYKLTEPVSQGKVETLPLKPRDQDSLRRMKSRLTELAAQTQAFDDGVSLFGPTECSDKQTEVAVAPTPRLVQLATDLDDMLVGWRAGARRKVEDACQRLLDFVREDDNE
ncbi:hypothetical protein [Mycolicibacter kumamotonensis]|uniref:Uncharacterized protein n=1 Tax=Mycolicibacter kumamotonensis TaxID=354243 RepID=A0A1B8SL67_9MYCO|nr:hypothetical protein [Mycolicibacter kumamotonensis]OBY33471.1 hypothetical protein ACT18_00540 [Mycolicibacter kumamotonensis]